jgi:hypothetical protein
MKNKSFQEVVLNKHKLHKQGYKTQNMITKTSNGILKSNTLL